MKGSYLCHVWNLCKPFAPFYHNGLLLRVSSLKMSLQKVLYESRNLGSGSHELRAYACGFSDSQSSCYQCTPRRLAKLPLGKVSEAALLPCSSLNGSSLGSRLGFWLFASSRRAHGLLSLMALLLFGVINPKPPAVLGFVVGDPVFQNTGSQGRDISPF